MTHEFYKGWLKFTAVVIGGFGPVFFLATMAATDELPRWSLDLLSWPIDGAQTFAEPTTRFLAALTGGFLAGWGVTIWKLSGEIYDGAPEAVRKAVLYGACAWFLLDSAGSVTSGNPSNVGFNLIILLVAIGPMWRPVQSA
jgi:hypothetical protein